MGGNCLQGAPQCELNVGKAKMLISRIRLRSSWRTRRPTMRWPQTRWAASSQPRGALTRGMFGEEWDHNRCERNGLPSKSPANPRGAKLAELAWGPRPVDHCSDAKRCPPRRLHAQANAGHWGLGR
eukprot:4791431-Pyramimonas_sp.AAC.1